MSAVRPSIAISFCVRAAVCLRAVSDGSDRRIARLTCEFGEEIEVVPDLNFRPLDSLGSKGLSWIARGTSADLNHLEPLG